MRKVKMFASSPNEATPHTAERNAAHTISEDSVRSRELEFARRGRIAPLSGPVMSAGGTHPVWNPRSFDFQTGPSPASVHPGLWQQAQLNNESGLFEIADGFYQVRGIDLSNITFIRGEAGWIVIDPLTSAETAAGALALLHEHFSPRPVLNVIYTHSHIDHFAGVRGVVNQADVDNGTVNIYAPDGFLDAAVSENIIAGNAMTRRASYMYGALLPVSVHGHIDSGLGKGVPLLATTGLIAPTHSIVETGAEHVIDGIRVVFQVTPDTEAPAEMNFHFPDQRILCMAENCSATMHNLYTPRGALIRDALAWSRAIDDSIELFADSSDVCFASHHWPRWGSDVVRSYLESQRDLYRFLHDQTMRLANHGFTMNEIAEQVTLPASLSDESFNRGYYGTVSHNTKAVYQRYLGWFDANPANLNPLPPEDSSRKWVEYMGGAAAVLDRAQVDYDNGEYRWVAEVVNKVVFADPENAAARALQAAALEQLGYQSESGPWRDFYLTGAQELRHGPPGLPTRFGQSPDMLAATTVDMLLRVLGVRLNPDRISALTTEFDLLIHDRGEHHLVRVARSALSHRRIDAPRTNTLISTTHAVFGGLATGQLSIVDAVEAGTLTVSGPSDFAFQIFDALDTFNGWFAIVTP
jgi:alkyl sulfatase BDS1-like metallo-beta-lactamase superfamily hydrolase